jgi:hypothetical protein
LVRLPEKPQTTPSLISKEKRANLNLPAYLKTKKNQKAVLTHVVDNANIEEQF